MHNAASIKLFSRLGFKMTKIVEVFEEVEMRPNQGVTFSECGKRNMVSLFTEHDFHHFKLAIPKQSVITGF